MKIEFFPRIFGKYSNAKSHGNPANVSRVASCGHKRRHTDMTKIIAAPSILGTRRKMRKKYLSLEVRRDFEETSI
jgi:hypothetical protein